MDTVRADHLPCYGYGIDTAPNVCGLAEEGALFTNALSQSAWTLAAHASILTGVYPHAHRAENGSTPIDDGAPRLARIMSRNRFATGAIVSSRFVNAKYGFKRGFQYFDDSPDKRGNDNSYAREITDKAVSWLDEQPDPFFLWLHFYDPHHAFLHHDSGFTYTFRFDRTMVIVTSDHGEAFGDHEHVGHGKLLYQELALLDTPAKHFGV